MVNPISKRLQVFVSSTYLDLIEERQAAVQAILEANHIPAGMELFTAGDKSQWEVIKHWIDQSDVFLLILGGRYGSIETETGKSYIHLEYEYALEKDIPVFACVIRDANKKAIEKQDIDKYLERDNPQQYQDFKNLVTSKMVKFWETSNDIEKSIILTLKEFEKRQNIIGWVRVCQNLDISFFEEELESLKNENKELEKSLKTQKEVYDKKIQELQQSFKSQNKHYNEHLDISKKLQNGLEKQIDIAKKQNDLSKKSHQLALERNDLTINRLKQELKRLQSLVKIDFELKSEKGIDYTKLRDLLIAGKWKEADEETAKVITEVSDNIAEFPSDDLQTIDTLWRYFSNDKFGFSIQKKIYLDDLGGTKEYNEQIWYKFCDFVGWRKGENWLNYENFTFDLADTTPNGHLPYISHKKYNTYPLLLRKDL